jgi:predicted house-cleaning noncanonical NTP pyrophosphatase (MazG superfamily)
MLFSIYYKIEHRNEFLEKYFDKVLKQFDDMERVNSIERLTDLMELMVKMLINQDKYGLYNLLTKKNSKNVRLFFNYLTCSNIRSINKEIVKSRIKEIFN